MKESPIEWTQYTFNPWMGCTNVSPGCANCYATTSTPVRVFNVEWGKGKPRHRTGESKWKAVRSLDRKSAKAGVRTKVFCASLADWLDPEAPSFWLCDLLELIASTPNLDWQLVTKRPELFRDRMASVMRDWEGTPGAKVADRWRNFRISPKNVWFGCTAENQKTFDHRTQEMAYIDARVKFLSMEPLLESVKMNFGLTRPVDWIIVGGESGSHARVTDIEWIESIVTQSQSLKIPVFVKQLGSHAYYQQLRFNTVSKKGGDITEFPEHLRIRDFPQIVNF
jgi:protein gp37